MLSGTLDEQGLVFVLTPFITEEEGSDKCTNQYNARRGMAEGRERPRVAGRTRNALVSETGLE